MASKVCSHNNIRPLRSQYLEIEDLKIVERMNECLDCGVLFNSYEVRNLDLRNNNEQILDNLPPPLKESKEERANRFFENQSFDKASCEYSELITDYFSQSKTFQKENEFNKVYWVNRFALSETYAGRSENGIYFLENEIKSDSKNAYLYIVQRGEIKYFLKDYHEAIKDYNLGIKAKPQEGKFYTLRGNAHIRLKNYQKAIEDFSNRIKLSPGIKSDNELPEMYFRSGFLKFEISDYENAIIDFEAAISLLVNSRWLHDMRLLKECYQYRGESSFLLTNYEDAINDFNLSIDVLYPSNHDYLIRGLAKQKLGDYYGSIADFTKGFKNDPKNGDFIVRRGFVKKLSGDFQGAINDYTKAIKLKLVDTKLDEIFHMRSKANFELGNYEKAISDCEKAIDLDPKNNFHLKLKDDLENNISD